MDTIFSKDTIIQIINTLEKNSNNSELYKSILDSQTDVYNSFIIILLGIFAVFAGATWLYNTKVAKKEIIKETDKIFKEEKEKLIKEFKNEFEILIEQVKKDHKKEVNFIRGESARLFAISTGKSDNPGSVVNTVYWWLQAIMFYKLVDNGEGVRIAVNNVIISIQKCDLQKDSCKKYFYEETIYNYENLLNIIETIPDTLIMEKRELKTIFTAIFKQ